MNGLSKGSMPTPERDDRTASRSGFQSEDGITVAFSSPPAMSASRDMPSGKTVSPARTLRKANGSEAFGGCTVRSAISSAGMTFIHRLLGDCQYEFFLAASPCGFLIGLWKTLNGKSSLKRGGSSRAFCACNRKDR